MSEQKIETAYERWELVSLNEDRFKHPDPSIAKLAQEIIDGRQAEFAEGRKEGQAEGFAQGREEGFAQGLEEAKVEINEKIALLVAMQAKLSQQIQFVREEMAKELVDLTLNAGRALVSNALEAKPDLINDVIQQALQGIPVFQLPAKIMLHPKDALLVEEFQGPALKQAGWVIQPNDQVARGDCLIETGSNRIDASIESKWQKLAIAMGKKPAEDQI
jgi:flagellar assembly protein FliH